MVHTFRVESVCTRMQKGDIRRRECEDRTDRVMFIIWMGVGLGRTKRARLPAIGNRTMLFAKTCLTGWKARLCLAKQARPIDASRPSKSRPFLLRPSTGHRNLFS